MAGGLTGDFPSEAELIDPRSRHRFGGGAAESVRGGLAGGLTRDHFGGGTAEGVRGRRWRLVGKHFQHGIPGSGSADSRSRWLHPWPVHKFGGPTPDTIGAELPCGLSRRRCGGRAPAALSGLPNCSECIVDSLAGRFRELGVVAACPAFPDLRQLLVYKFTQIPVFTDLRHERAELLLVQLSDQVVHLACGRLGDPFGLLGRGQICKVSSLLTGLCTCRSAGLLAGLCASASASLLTGLCACGLARLLAEFCFNQVVQALGQARLLTWGDRCTWSGRGSRGSSKSGTLSGALDPAPETLGTALDTASDLTP